MATFEQSVTLPQIAKLMTLMADKGVDRKTLEIALSEGILADIFDSEAHIRGCREYVQQALGLRPATRLFREINLTNDVGALRRRLTKVNQGSLLKESDCFQDMWERVERLKDRTATLVFPKVSDLGFPHGALYGDAREEGRNFGFESCPPEIGIQLSVQKDQFVDWTYGTHFHLMMQPIIDGGGRYFFSSSRTHQPWVEVLNVVSEGPDKGLPLSADQHLVFLVPKQSH